MVSKAAGLTCGSRTNALPFSLSNDTVVLRLTFHFSGKREQWEWRVGTHRLKAESYFPQKYLRKITLSLGLSHLTCSVSN